MLDVTKVQHHFDLSEQTDWQIEVVLSRHHRLTNQRFVKPEVVLEGDVSGVKPKVMLAQEAMSGFVKLLTGPSNTLDTLYSKSGHL